MFVNPQRRVTSMSTPSVHPANTAPMARVSHVFVTQAPRSVTASASRCVVPTVVSGITAHFAAAPNIVRMALVRLVPVHLVRSAAMARR